MENKKTIKNEETNIKSKIKCVQTIVPRSVSRMHEANIEFVFTGKFKDFFVYMDSVRNGHILWENSMAIVADMEMKVNALVYICDGDGDNFYGGESFKGFEICPSYGLVGSKNDYFTDAYKAEESEDLNEAAWRIMGEALLENFERNVERNALIDDAKQILGAREQQMENNASINRVDTYMKSKIECEQTIISKPPLSYPGPKLGYVFTGALRNFFYKNSEGDDYVEWEGRFNLVGSLETKVTMVIMPCDKDSDSYPLHEKITGFAITPYYEISKNAQMHSANTYHVSAKEDLRESCWQIMRMVLDEAALEALLSDASDVAKRAMDYQKYLESM
jgi:hypothetical protein